MLRFLRLPFRLSLEATGLLICVTLLPSLAQSGRVHAIASLACCLLSATYFLCMYSCHFSRWFFRLMATFIVITGILVTVGLYVGRQVAQSASSGSYP